MQIARFYNRLRDVDEKLKWLDENVRMLVVEMGQCKAYINYALDNPNGFAEWCKTHDEWKLTQKKATRRIPLRKAAKKVGSP